MLTILFFFILIFARISTCYDSRISKGKYITIKNKTLAKLLIEKQNIFNGKYTLKKDRNKMSIIGLIFYLSIIFIILLFLILYAIPQIPCETFELNTTKIYLYVDTLNKKIPVIATLILFFVEFLYFSILIFRFNKEIKQKWIKVLVYTVSMLMGFISIALILEMLFELVKL